jgi:hypothetical protein
MVTSCSNAEITRRDNIASGGGPTFVAEAKGIGGRG